MRNILKIATALAALSLATTANATTVFELVASYDGNAYIMDSDLSADDCLSAYTAITLGVLVGTDSKISLDGRHSIPTIDVDFSCERKG